MSEACEACRFYATWKYQGTEIVDGGFWRGWDAKPVTKTAHQCRRYPKTEKVHPKDWCGEYQPAGDKDA